MSAKLKETSKKTREQKKTWDTENRQNVEDVNPTTRTVTLNMNGLNNLSKIETDRLD